MLGVFGLATFVVVVVSASYPDENALYEDMLVQDLYKHLNDIAEANYYDEASYGAKPSWMNDIALESRESGQAEIRDQEHLEHSSNNGGVQYISGGAGEGKQHLKPTGTQDNKQEVKSDALPFYCHPPNPCPKGYKAKDGCHEFIKDNAEFQQEWILKMQKKGMCACDEEHMFRCPKSPDEEIQAKYVESDLDDLLGQLLTSPNEKNPYIDPQSKREFLVAKKSPRVKRSVSEIDKALEEMKALKPSKHSNPYLKGFQIHTVAKKG